MFEERFNAVARQSRDHHDALSRDLRRAMRRADRWCLIAALAYAVGLLAIVALSWGGLQP